MMRRLTTFSLALLLSCVVNAVPLSGANRYAPVESIYLRAPLTTSIVPSIGPALTFARATTATTVDFEGLIRPVKSGEARFYGARRVENLLTNSHLNNSGGTAPTSWSASVIAGNGSITFGTTANGEPTVTCAGTGTADRAYINQAFTVVAGRQYRLSATILAVNGIFDFDIIKFANSTGQVTGNVGAKNNGSAAGRIASGVVTATVSGTVVVKFGFGTDNTSTRVASVTLYRPMLEEVSGQANQNPSEYVSSGALTTPYHGANVDGVRYFDYQNGNTVDGNEYVTEAQGAAISAGTQKGYFSEASKTNSVVRSEELQLWTPGGLNAFGSGSITDDANVVAPDGRTTAEYLQEDTSTGLHRVIQSVTHSTGDYTYSFFGRAAERSWVYISNATDGFSGYFDISNGTVGTLSGSGVTGACQAWPNSWYRCQIVYNVAAAAAKTMELRIASANGTASYTGDGTSGVHLWGAQVESLRGASSYIPTGSASASRNADALAFATPPFLDAHGACYAEAMSTIIPNGASANGGMGITSSSCAYLNSGAPLDSSSTYDGTTGLTLSGIGSWSSGRKAAVSWYGTRQVIYTGGSLNTAAYDGSKWTRHGTVGVGAATWSAGAGGALKDLIFWRYPPPHETLKAMTQ